MTKPIIKNIATLCIIGSALLYAGAMIIAYIAKSLINEVVLSEKRKKYYIIYCISMMLIIIGITLIMLIPFILQHHLDGVRSDYDIDRELTLIDRELELLS